MYISPTIKSNRQKINPKNNKQIIIINKKIIKNKNNKKHFDKNWVRIFIIYLFICSFAYLTCLYGVCICVCVWCVGTCMHRCVCLGRSEVEVLCRPQLITTLPFETRPRPLTRRFLFLLTGQSRSPKGPHLSFLPALVLQYGQGFSTLECKWGWDLNAGLYSYVYPLSHPRSALNLFFN